ncbi:hypothetical protein NECAME_04282 [Necator americanus]|uniref:Uncharacterized protein n=1 Tax=Necator americanus TaxID=51031 RepID=W2SXI9_NECAM|nr:hypothetical protein NECAME_04282 [Necator americanus]ETN73596.1 hypothetical protein NECAME_04282 [Necator americanus]
MLTSPSTLSSIFLEAVEELWSLLFFFTTPLLGTPGSSSASRVKNNLSRESDLRRIFRYKMFLSILDFPVL